ncbi:unnamed protein product [Chilo suppressalis]|uniref:Uncharacterized protein n=1 Tax=Chilo suppressalis TaxID=168631 RepID=A0ABN8AWG4_CHISP|nr:unnamed protein product [Chilo suppressalis]
MLGDYNQGRPPRAVRAVRPHRAPSYGGRRKRPNARLGTDRLRRASKSYCCKRVATSDERGGGEGKRCPNLNSEPISLSIFNPCGCHSLNLVVADAVKLSAKSVSLCEFLQRLFVIFSGLTKW